MEEEQVLGSLNDSARSEVSKFGAVPSADQGPAANVVTIEPLVSIYS
jgi:hypothetical protein